MIKYNRKDLRYPLVYTLLRISLCIMYIQYNPVSWSLGYAMRNCTRKFHHYAKISSVIETEIMVIGDYSAGKHAANYPRYPI
jgi:hypothetical protein